MVKFFTDEEMDEKCKDYDPIPMKVAQDVLHRKENPDRINILNGVIKSPYRIGQPPANVNMYASQIGMMTPVNAEAYLKEYNRFVTGRMIQEERELEQSLDEEDFEGSITSEDQFRRTREDQVRRADLLRERRIETNAKYYRRRVVRDVLEGMIGEIEDQAEQEPDV